MSVLSDSGMDLALLYNDEVRRAQLIALLFLIFVASRSVWSGFRRFLDIQTPMHCVTLQFIPRPEPEWMEVKPQRTARARGRKNEDNTKPFLPNNGNTRANNRQPGKTAVLPRPDGPKQPQSPPRKAPAAPSRPSGVPQTKPPGHQGGSADLGINVASSWPSLTQGQTAAQPRSAPQSVLQPTTKQEDAKESEAPLQTPAEDISRIAQGDETALSKDASVASPVSAEEKNPKSISSSQQADGLTPLPETPAPPRTMPAMTSGTPPGTSSDPDTPASLDPTAAAFVPGYGPGVPVPPPPSEAFMPWPVPPPPPHMWMYPPVPMPPHGYPMAPMPPLPHGPMPVTPPPPPPRPMISVAPPPGHEPPPRVSPHDLSPSASKHAGQQLLQLLQTGSAGDDNKQLLSPTRDLVTPVIVTPAAGSVRPTHAAA